MAKAHGAHRLRRHHPQQRRASEIRCRTAAGQPDELIITELGDNLVSVAPASGAWPPVVLRAYPDVARLRARLRDTVIRMSQNEPRM